MGRANAPDKDVLLSEADGERMTPSFCIGSGRRSAGASAAFAAAAAAAARSCAFFFGCAFSGLLRGSRFSAPTPSSRRATRSVGCAPLAIQALAFSTSSTRRSAASFGLQRIEGAELLDEAAVARQARVGDDNAVERTLLGAAARQTNFQRHVFFLCSVLQVRRERLVMAGPHPASAMTAECINSSSSSRTD